MGVASFQSAASGVNLHGVLSASRSAQALFYSVRCRSRAICTGGLDPIHHSRRQCPLALSHAPQDSSLLCCALQATFSPPRNCAVSNDTFSDFWAVMGIPMGVKKVESTLQTERVI